MQYTNVKGGMVNAYLLAAIGFTNFKAFDDLII